MPSISLKAKGTTTLQPKASEPAATPMMAQYLEVKAKHPDFLLFYRMGDFFELFFDDAVKASQALGIQLTKRGKHAGEDIPMCGVPVVRADEYLQKLIKRGFRVAVAEQLEDPEVAKKRGGKSVVKRDVVRLITAGTITEDTLLEGARHNFLTAISRAGDGSNAGFALATADISTGEFVISSARAEDLEGELMRIRPAEIIVGEENAREGLIAKAAQTCGGELSPVAASWFSSDKGEQELKEAFGLLTLEGLGEFQPAELEAAGALLKYIAFTQLGERPALRFPSREANGALLLIDAATRASLELVRPRNDGAPTVFSAIDRTVTGAGSRELLARLVSPLTDAERINARLDAVSFFLEDWALRERVRDLLKRAPDLSRALSRLKLNRGGPRDLGAIRDGLLAASAISRLIGETIDPPVEVADAAELLAFAESENKDGKGLVARLQAALGSTLPLMTRDGGFIAPGFLGELDELRQLASDAKVVIAKLQAQYIAETGIKSLKIQYNQVFGYFIEVSSAAAAPLLQGAQPTVFRHKQTLANAVRFVTDELAALETRILTATSDALALEFRLFEDLKAAVSEAERAISDVASALAALDCYTALAELAQSQGYCRPVVDSSHRFLIESGRHPAVEQTLVRDGGAFIGNDCKLDGAALAAPALQVVTGPNMAGKSTYLRQNALIAVLAQMGSFVPAKSAIIGVADRLFSRIGAADDLARGRSTFMVEMTETAAILNQATARSLVILDEIGRGTSTFDGLSIAWAVLEHLHDATRCRGLIATHYHELTALASRLPRAANIRMAVKEWKDTLVFLHTVEEGAAQRSYGIHAARLAGVPKTVIARARQILAQLESGGALSGPQLPLFNSAMPAEPAPEIETQVETHPVLDKLRAIDLDGLSPRDALSILYELRQTLAS